MHVACWLVKRRTKTQTRNLVVNRSLLLCFLSRHLKAGERNFENLRQLVQILKITKAGIFGYSNLHHYKAMLEAVYLITTLSTNIKERYIYSTISYRHSVVFHLGGGEREYTALENRGRPNNQDVYLCCGPAWYMFIHIFTLSRWVSIPAKHLQVR